MKIKIKRLGINGEGVGNIEGGELDNKVCFVSGVLPEEEAEVSLVTDKKNYAICRLENLLSKSKDRVEPKCPYFSICGGCDLQHLVEEKQLEFKKDKVQETLHKISKIDINVEPTISVNSYAYRNKMVYPVCTENGRAKVGMFRQNTHSIVGIENCLICEKIINEIYTDIKEYIENSNYTGYDFKRRCGDIKYVVIRSHSGQVIVTIVATKKLDLKQLYEFLHSRYERLGLSLVISNSDAEIMSGKYVHIAGIEKLNIEEFGVKYSVDNRGFLQVNNELKEQLYNAVLNEINTEDVVIDGYSGAGLLSAIIAKKCKQVVGIEINESASNSAKLLAKNNGLQNMECITSDIKDCIGKVLDKFGRCVVVLDPARSGCDSSVLGCLTNENNLKKIFKIVYVSCNPSTLARDLEKLKEHYAIKSVTPYNMFPQTKHIETLVCLQRQV